MNYWQEIKDKTAWRIGGSSVFTYKQALWYIKHDWKQSHSLVLSYSWLKTDLGKAFYWYSSCWKTIKQDWRRINWTFWNKTYHNMILTAIDSGH